MLRDYLFSNNTRLSDEQLDLLLESHRDFNYAFEYFLNKVNSHRTPLNKRFRLFVTAVFLLNANKKSQIVDSQFAEILQCSRETVGRIRKRFDAWQYSENHNLVEIIEGEYLRPTKENPKPHYSPTSYKITFGRLLIEAISEAKEMTLYEKNPLRAIEFAIDARLSLVDQNYKTQKRKIKKERPLNALQKTAEKMFATITRENLELAQLNNQDVRLRWDSLIEIGYEIVFQVEDNPTNRRRNPKIFDRGKE